LLPTTLCRFVYMTHTKIPVTHPIVVIDGDEMAQVMWDAIRRMLILPYVDAPFLLFDLSIQHRDATQDQVTYEAAQSIRQHGVGIKCATITPDRGRVKEFGLQAQWPSPNGTIRNVLNGVVFREPILCPSIPRYVPHWQAPIVVARHAFGDQYAARDLIIDTPGSLTLTFTPVEGTPRTYTVHDFSAPGVAMAMYNEDDSITGFARSCFRYGLMRHLPVYFSAKDTILKQYDGRFRHIFDTVFRSEFADSFASAGLTYEYRLIDDMVAHAIKSEGGFLWALKNYDGDVQSDSIAQGFGSLGMMTSVLLSADGKCTETEAAHGTVTRHYRAHQAGQETSTNPVASIFAWTRGLWSRGQKDANPRLIQFATKLEQHVLDTISAGIMTKDLAQRVSDTHPYVSTTMFLENVAMRLSKDYGQS